MIGDSAAVERAERAVGQLAKAGDDLRKKHVKLVSRIKQDELELAEVNSLLNVLQAAYVFLWGDFAWAVIIYHWPRGAFFFPDGAVVWPGQCLVCGFGAWVLRHCGIAGA